MTHVKASFFLARMVVFNETFADMKQTVTDRRKAHYCMLWHEAESGRSAHDIASAFLKFLHQIRDHEKVILWLDNCSAQNKNYVIFSALMAAVNSARISTSEIILRYLVSGHTSMSPDGIHGKIEQKMRKPGNVYDITDFEKICKEATVASLAIPVT